jgi:hypothetical protein
MEVIDGYRRTLRIFLPKHERDDIIRELAEEIRSQVAEREAALGRPLDAAEQAAIIGQYGHPLLTAARYRPHRHLIGPVVFPYFLIVMKIALGLVAAAHVIGAIVLLGTGAAVGELASIGERAIATSLKVVGWITLLAAVADLWLSRSGALEKWNPRIPPRPLDRARRSVESALSGLPGPPSSHARSGQGTPRATARPVSSLVIGATLSVWWLAGLRFPHLFFGPGAAGLEWGPAMDRLYPVLVVSQVTLLVHQFYLVTRRDDVRVFRMMRIVWFGTGWTLIYLVATSGHEWMVWSGEIAARANATVVLRLAGVDVTLVEFVNGIWSIVFISVAIASAFGSFTALFQRFRQGPTALHA